MWYLWKLNVLRAALVNPGMEIINDIARMKIRRLE